MRYGTLFLILIFFSFSCSKEPKHDYNEHPLELTYSLGSERAEFDWNKRDSKLKFTYNLYASNSPITYSSNTGIVSGRLIASGDFNQFIDKEFDFIEFTYFRVFARTENVTVASKNLQLSGRGFFKMQTGHTSNIKIISIPYSKN